LIVLSEQHFQPHPRQRLIQTSSVITPDANTAQNHAVALDRQPALVGRQIKISKFADAVALSLQFFSVLVRIRNHDGSSVGLAEVMAAAEQSQLALA